MEVLIYGWDWLSLKACSQVGLVYLVMAVAALLWGFKPTLRNPNDKDKT